jgi:hypothetical protein
MNTISPNSLSDRAFSAASFEILGDACGPAVGLAELCDYLGMNFNPACACGLAQQIGRSAFTHLVRGTNGLDNLTVQSFDLLPVKLRLSRGLEPLEKLIETLFDIPVQMVDDRDAIRLETTECYKGHALIPHLETGFIQEYVHWASGGKFHPVSMNASTPGWTIQIGKQPLES